MKLINTQKEYQEGKINKAEYIQTMYQEHHTKLYDYQEYIINTDINTISITESGVIFDCGIHNIKILGEEQDFRIAPIEILNFLKYEPEETKMMLNLLPSSAHIFDIGANAGWFSFLFAANDATAKIYAFEPIPKTFSNLNKNLKLNNFKNISLFNFGLSTTNEKLDFYYYPEGSGNASSVNVSSREQITVVESFVKKLDDCFNGITSKLDFIKCDVEVAELLVFQGGINTLKKHQPIVFSEILRKWSAKFDYHPNDILQLFKNIGYKCFVAHNDKLLQIVEVDDNTIETNFFFLHTVKHANLIQKFATC